MSGFAAFVRHHRDSGALVVQPRMGFSRPERMRAGLLAVKGVDGPTVGTITLDSYTRVGDHESAARAVRDGADLNGFPLVAHGAAVTRGMLDGVSGPDFPVQVRHGSPLPHRLVEVALAAGLDATEGGPVSYCLPYSRTPLRAAVDDWSRTCDLLAAHDAHLESFGGCLLGQLCPPGLLVAIAVLEGVFFRAHGLRSVSLSYAQQAHLGQDVAAVRALSSLAATYLSDVDWHIVVYTYMGVFPRTPGGAAAVLADSVRLARHAGAARLVVKTAAEAHRIPTIAENVTALRDALSVPDSPAPEAEPDDVLHEATALVEAVLSLADDPGTALVRAFDTGLLDIPYCLHPDNPNRARAALGADGRLRWTDVGDMPIAGITEPAAPAELSAAALLTMLTRVEHRYDNRIGPAAPIPTLRGDDR